MFRFIVGGCYEYSMGLLYMNEYGWRVIVLITAIPTVICCLAAFFIYESPRFLYVSGRYDKMNLTLQVRDNMGVLASRDQYIATYVIHHVIMGSII